LYVDHLIKYKLLSLNYTYFKAILLIELSFFLGHEFPYVIKMNYLREAGRSIKDDDNSHKFILIDKNARKVSNLNSAHQNNNINTESSSSANRPSSNLTTMPTVNNTVSARASDLPGSQTKEFDTEAYKLQKLRKKIFGNRTNAAENSINLAESSIVITKQPVLKSTSVDVVQVASLTSTKVENKLLNSFKKSEATSNASILQLRSTSLSHSGSYKQQRSESVNLIKSSGLHSKKSSVGATDLSIAHAKHLNNHSNYSHSITNSTLKPFYSKLKKTHLFGVKLEKLCGVYSHLNCKLPIQIMVMFQASV